MTMRSLHERAYRSTLCSSPVLVPGLVALISPKSLVGRALSARLDCCASSASEVLTPQRQLSESAI